MQIRDLIPWGRSKEPAPSPSAEADNPVSVLQRDVNRVFEDFWARFERPFGGNGALGPVGPRTDISETDQEIEVAVELPGLDEAALKKLYKRRALELHPDKSSHPDAPARFRRLQEAYEALKEPGTRSFFARTSSVLIHISSIALRSASEQEKDSPFVPQTKTALKPSATR